MPSPTWIFREAPPDGGRVGGDLARMNFTRDLAAFAREVLQNSLDARPRDARQPVVVRFELQERRGAGKRRFLQAAGFHQLAPHLQAAARTSGSLGDGLARARSATEPLRLLLVHDLHASGLSGPERGDGRYASLVRHKLVSDKGDAAAGGSFGLGKSVLWMWSGWSTVFIRSRLMDPGPGEPRDRFVGVAQLPSHVVESGNQRGHWDGPGWLGERASEERDPHKVYARSYTIEEERAAALGLVRPSADAPGTSILVADFLGVEDGDGFDAEAAFAEIERAAVEHFWPALAADPPRMRVEIAAGETVKILDPLGNRRFRAFAHLAGLAEDPSVTGRTLEREEPLSLPSTRPFCAAETDELGPDQARLLEHGKTTVERAISVRAVEYDAAVEAGEEPEPRAVLALLRGSGMVVRYEEFAAPKPALAVALAGRAHGDSADDLRVERFLRTAEPPRHDDWTADAPYLAERYRSGYKGELRGLKRRLKEAVLRLLRDDAERARSDEVPRALQRALRFGGRSGTRHGKRPRMRFEIEDFRRAPDGDAPAWIFSGWIDAEGEGAFEIAVDVSIAGDGGKVPLATKSLVVNGTPALAVQPGRFLVERPGHLEFEAAVVLDDGSVADYAGGRTLVMNLAALSFRLRRIATPTSEKEPVS